MAWAAQPRFLSPPLPPPQSTSKSTAIQSSLSFPPKPTKKSNRKNYLRPKLPISPHTPLQEIPTTQHLFHRPKDEFLQKEGKDVAPDDGKREFDLQTTAISSLSAFGSGNSFVGIAFVWLGLIVVQTLVSVWFLCSSDVDEKSGDGNSAVGVSPPGVVDGGGVGEIGNVGGTLDGPDFEKKVSEIRVMAKEARALEQKKAGNVIEESSSVAGADDDGIVAEDALSSIKTDVRKELAQWLMKLQKSLHSQREKSSKSSNSNAKGEDWAFRRKLKPGTSSTMSRNDPKGFGGSKSKRGQSRNENRKGASSQEREKDAEDGNVGEEESHWLRDEVLERIVLKVRDNALAGRDPFVGFGSEEELNFFQALERKFNREGESAEQWMENMLEGISFENGHIQEGNKQSPLEGSMEPYDTIPSTSNGGSKKGRQTRIVEGKLELHEAKNVQLDVEKNSWWLKLPYVYAILLRRGGDCKNPRGLYSLKMNSHSDYESSAVCTITFEDHSDATNFCQILESFFEDLDDFSAEAFPLSIKEIEEALKSSSLKVIVVRKRQLRLYAGQPLEDVEMALQSIVV